MRYLVYLTEAEAIQAEGIIFEFGKGLAKAQGHTVDADGIHAIGHNLDYSISAGVTTSWSDPRQRADGKWVIVHPENHAVSADANLLSQLMTLLGTISEEHSDGTWWPEA